MPTGQSSIRLFRFAGIDVYLHWAWFVFAIYEINGRPAIEAFARLLKGPLAEDIRRVRAVRRGWRRR